MTLLRVYTLVTGAVILLATAAYATASGETAIGLFALPTLAVLWWLSSRVGQRLLLPRTAVNLLLIAALAYGGWRMFGDGVDITSIAQIVVLLLAIKITDRRSHRDDAQVILLGVFLAVAAVLDSNRLAVGIQLLVLLPTLIASIMLYQLHPAYWPELERVTPAPRVISGQPRRSPARAVAAATAWATPAMLAIAWLIFLIIPRGMGENAFGQWGRPQGSSVTGFTDRVSLGRRNIISESPEIVFDARIEEIRPDGRAESIGAIDRVFYLRGAVLDVYTDGQWSSTQGLGSGVVDNRLTNHRHELRRPVRQRVQIRQTITLRDPVPRNQTVPLFHLFPPIAVQADRVGWILIEPSTMILSFRGDGGQLQYAVWSYSVDEREAPPPPRARPIAPHARLVELASRIVTDGGVSPDPDIRPVEDDARAIQSIMDWLRTGFTYSLEEPLVPDGVDPIDHFLFTTRTGHCEYFASAMVFLCRAVGIHARIVTGYVAAEYNEASGHYTVRQSNAHAWVEAGRVRWGRFDPTPPSDLVRLHRPEPTLASRIRSWLDAVEYAWNSSFVAFDESRRQRLMSPTGVAKSQSAWIDRMSRAMAEAARGDQRRSAWGAIAIFVAAGAMVLAGVLLWPWLRRALPRIRRSSRTQARTGPAGRLYAQLLAELARRGLSKPLWRPPIEHAEAIPLDASDLRSVARDIAALYYEQRFAGRMPEASRLADARRRLRAIGRVHRS